jgi:hypothetical protein
MIEESIGFPPGFYVALMLLVAALFSSWKLREGGVGIPMAGCWALWPYGISGCALQ